MKPFHPSCLLAALTSASLVLNVFGLPSDVAAANSSNNNNTVIDVTISSSADARILRSDLIGYSIEPTAVTDFTSNSLARNLLDVIQQVAQGQAAPIRVGGTTADEIVIVPSSGNATSAHLTTTGQTDENLQTSVDAEWFDLWTKYFSKDTDLIFTLNFRNTTDRWAVARRQAELIFNSTAQNGNLKRLEFGNEVDHYINKKWRDASWGVQEYIKQWTSLHKEIQDLAGFQQYKPSPPKFQAAVFADPPLVPDQQDEIDDFSIVNLTKAGFRNEGGDVSGYAVHLYPQSNCDAVRKARLSLDLLVDHSVIYKNLSQYIPQEQAARDPGGAPLLLGETNSVSCSGKSGISDVFGAALWMVDYSLTAASLGIEQVFYHLGNQSPYSAFVPKPFTTPAGEKVEAGVRANYYSHWFLAHVASGSAQTEAKALSVKAFSNSTSADFSSFAVYNAQASLEKVVLVDLGHWNSSQGISNPSTESSTDSKSVSPGQRPTRQVQLKTSWKQGSKAQVIRMQGPGINAKSLVTVAGQTVSQKDGSVQGQKKTETLIVGANGTVDVRMDQAEAVLLSVQ